MEKFFFIDSAKKPAVTAGNDHIFTCPCVRVVRPHFSNKSNGRTAILAEVIIDDSSSNDRPYHHS